jgi:signal transduction histidine kinase
VVRRIPIRAKVAAALAVPLIGLATAAGMGAAVSAEESRDVSRQSDLTTASAGYAALVDAVRDERDLALVSMLGVAAGIELDTMDIGDSRRRTEATADRLNRLLPERGGDVASDGATALGTLAGLTGLRGQVDASVTTPGAGNVEVAHQAFAGYSSVVTTLSGAHDRLALGIEDELLHQGDALGRDAARASDAAAQLVERLAYLGLGPGGLDQPAEVGQIAELRRDVERANLSISTLGTSPYADATVELLANPRVAGITGFAAEAVLRGGAVDALSLLATAPLGPEGGYQPFRAEVAGLVEARAGDLQSDADARLRLFLGGGAAVVVVAVLVAWWVSRSITRPLHQLSQAARTTATEQLPRAVHGILDAPPGEDVVLPDVEPIRVDSRDEVADVASAFNLVQSSAVGLASEQAALRRNVAESYVNLGRRNQNLLSRLLGVVAELEADEPDPTSRDKLYRLSHLATRIRRNAESLLVLSQAASPAPWTPPVALSEVVRAALGEIEDYDRVEVRALDHAMVVGASSSDLAHLLAELIENGLRHSPPREHVEVNGRTTANGYTITVVDHGLGMTPDEIEQANQRLAGAESFTVTPARYLGHYVTAVLAARHGISVRLQGSVVVGIAARVDLPARLLVDQPDVLALPPAGGTVAAPPPEPSSEPPARLPVPVAAVVDDEPAGYREPAGSTRRLSSWALLVSELPRFGGPGGEGADVGRHDAGHDTGPVPIVVRSAAPGSPGPYASAASPGRDPDAQPERTASGLVRRVPGAHVRNPEGQATTEPPAPAAPAPSTPSTAEPPAPAAPAPSTPSTAEPPAPAAPAPTSRAGIQHFLTNLADGVQRSLDQRTGPDADGKRSG